MTRSFPLFLFASALAVGCGGWSARPPPRPTPTSTDATAKRPTGIVFVQPYGWHHDASGHRSVSYANEAEHAKIAFRLVAPSEKGRLHALLEYRRTVMQRPEIRSRPFINERGIVIWSFTHRLDDGPIIKGIVLTEPSNMPGYGIMVLGTWPDAETEEVLPQFLLMAKTVRLR